MSRQDSEGGAGYAFVLASVAALGGLLFGYDTAVISGAIGYLSDYFGLDAHMRGWPLTTTRGRAGMGCSRLPEKKMLYCWSRKGIRSWSPAGYCKSARAASTQ